MNEEKVKQTITDLKTVHQAYDVMCGDWSFVWTAIEALEKQIPKKPTFTEGNPYFNRYLNGKNISNYWCPTCECEVDKDRDYYCSQCGQHLLWEEGNV